MADVIEFGVERVNECQNMVKPVGKIRFVTRDPGYKNLLLFPYILSEDLWIFALNRARVSSPSLCINIIHNYVPV
jgi:hypothetical protein